MVTGIILASGLSKRMERDKLLINLGGKAIVEHVVKACVNSNLDKIILVYRKEEVKSIGEKWGVETIYNENAKLGQSQAMRVGLSIADNDSSFMFLMGDQPFVNPDLINRLIKEYKNVDLPLIVPFYNGCKGAPIIFGGQYREELLKVQGDIGGRKIVERDYFNIHRVYINDIKLGIDIDTENDLEMVKKWI